MEKSLINVGDTIITTDKFTKGKGIKGQLVKIVDKSYGVDFKKEINGLRTHNIESTILTPTGFYLKREEFKLTKSYKNSNIEEKDFVNSMNKRSFAINPSLQYNLSDKKSQINYDISNIKSLKRNILEKKENIKNSNLEIIKINKILYNKIGIKDFEEQFKRLKKSDKIKDIKILDQYIIVTTNNITYKKTDRVNPFVLGAYKIFISINSRDVYAVNYKKHYLKYASHPCIKDGGKICMGEFVNKRIEELHQKNQIDLIVFLLISFLEEPNYNNPYVVDEDFQYAQKVTIKPTNILNYLDSQYWERYEVWDAELFRKQRAIITPIQTQ